MTNTNDITVQNVRDALSIYGVTTGLTDSQITALIGYKTNELSELIGVPIGTVSKEYTNLDFLGNRVFLPLYPVNNITSIKLGDTDITDYKLKKNDGYIKLSTTLQGELTVNYDYGLNLDNMLKNLIIDMIVSQCKYGLDGGASSVREGDVSVTYNGNGFNDNIQTRIDNLRNTYSGRLRLL